MATNPPALDPPTTRSRLVEVFESIESWGEHSPAAMQAILDALDAETVPAIDSLDDLENVEGSDLPYVVKGNDTDPGDLPDQAIPTGKQIKSLSSTLSDQLDSIDSGKLDSVSTVSDISAPDNNDRYHVANLGTTVRYDGNSGRFEIEDVGRVNGTSASDLPPSDQFTTGSEIITRGNGKTWKVTA